MEKRMILLYAITLFSLIAVVYLFFGVLSKIPNMSDKNFMSLTGNVVLDLNNDFKIGDNVQGDIILNKEESNAYGILLLTKEDKPLITKTFNLKDISKNKISSGEYSIKIEDLINYSFEEKGNYELFLSVLDLNINIKKEFVVK